jgi:hypothetical protein
MQWIYAYLITDILLLLRYFSVYIIHTKSTECEPNNVWASFVCYFEATLDNYLNLLEVYILLALNICRYVQIAYNRNVYTTDVRLLIVAHFSIYLLPIIVLIVQFLTGWAQLEHYFNEICDVLYTNVYVQIFNIITGYALPIALNIVVIYASVRHVHLASGLQRTLHHVSAREKYHRSLVIQFVCFYIIWLALWSPNVIVYQLTSGESPITLAVRLINFIEIALDPIIIGALDVRFWHVWKKIWLRLKNDYLKRLQPQERRIIPIITNPGIQGAKKQQETPL